MSWDGGQSRIGAVIVGFRNGNRIVRVSPDSTLEDSKNNINSDPDPGCLDSDPSDQDNNASTAQPEDSSTWLNLESIFENTHLKDSPNSIKFIWALQSASHDGIHCKWRRTLSNSWETCQQHLLTLLHFLTYTLALTSSLQIWTPPSIPSMPIRMWSYNDIRKIKSLCMLRWNISLVKSQELTPLFTLCARIVFLHSQGPLPTSTTAWDVANLNFVQSQRSLSRNAIPYC